MTEQMLCNEKTRPTIVDSYQVVLGPHRIRRVAPVKQHDLNAGPIECTDNAIVDGILCGCEFERREENAGDFLCDVLMTKVLGLFLLLGRLSHRVTPKQGVRL